MKTLCQKYPNIAVGQGALVAIMPIWGKWYYVVPTTLAARLAYTNRHWIAQQADQGRLIATKMSGAWWIALVEYQNTPQDCVTSPQRCRTIAISENL